ncbi:hypothetical protein K523DRAFT_365873 [Schizophyllum commune Tattone D]|nr:hypothetical protein K523DRAFT_365873 [Schizophyllum commune Tattone D]
MHPAAARRPARAAVDLYAGLANDSSSGSGDSSNVEVATSWTAHPHLKTLPALEAAIAAGDSSAGQLALRGADDDLAVRSLVEDYTGSRNAKVVLFHKFTIFSIRINRRLNDPPNLRVRHLRQPVAQGPATHLPRLDAALAARRPAGAVDVVYGLLFLHRAFRGFASRIYRPFRISPVTAIDEPRPIHDVYNALADGGDPESVLGTGEMAICNSEVDQGFLDIRVEIRPECMSDKARIRQLMPKIASLPHSYPCPRISEVVWSFDIDYCARPLFKTYYGESAVPSRHHVASSTFESFVPSAYWLLSSKRRRLPLGDEAAVFR